MDSKDYLGWCSVDNTVKNRLKENSLVHTFTSKKSIRRNTKLFNKEIKKFSKNKTYSQFLKCKKNILKKVTENIDETDESDFSDNDFKKFYNSFDISYTKGSQDNVNEDCFSWLQVYKKGRKRTESENTYESSIKTIITNGNDISKTYYSLTEDSFKKDNDINIESFNTDNDFIKNINVANVSKSNSLRKNAKNSENHKSKNSLNVKNLETVKINLMPLINNTSLKNNESSEQDDWNEFVSSDFKAQSTQIFSDTFSEKDSKKNKRYRSKFKIIENEIINHPKDSGIEEDSKEENINSKNINNYKKLNNEEFYSNYNEFDIQENKKVFAQIHQNIEEIKNKEVNSTKSKRFPLKIIGEQTVTKKYKIINNTNKEIGSIPEEENISKFEYENNSAHNNLNDDTEDSKKSDNMYMDCQNTEITTNVENKESSDEYYNLDDDDNGIDLEDFSKNSITKSRKNVQNNLGNSNKDQTLRKKFKKCKSPYLVSQYRELKKLRLIEDSPNEESDFEQNKFKKIDNTINNNKKTSLNIKTPVTKKANKKNNIIDNNASKTEKTKNVSIITNHLIDNFEIENCNHEKSELRSTNDNAVQKVLNDNNSNELTKIISSLTSEDSNDGKETIFLNKPKYNSSTNVITNTINKLNENKQEKDEQENQISFNLENHVHKTKFKTKTKLNNSIEDEKNVMSNTTNSSQSSQINKEDIEFNTKNDDKKINNDILSNHNQSFEIEMQCDLKNIIDIYKENQLPKVTEYTNDKNDRINNNEIEKEDEILSDTHERLQQIKKIDFLADSESEEDEEEFNTKCKTKNKKLKNIYVENDREDIKNLKYSKDKINKLNQTSSDEDIKEPENHNIKIFNDKENNDDIIDKEDTMTLNTKIHLQNMKKLDLCNDEDSDVGSNRMKTQDINSDIDIEEHKILIPNDFKEGIKNIDQCNTDNVLDQNLKQDNTCQASIKGSNSTSQDIDVLYYSSENEEIKEKKKIFNKEIDEEDMHLSSSIENRLKQLKRLDLHDEKSEEESEDEKLNKLTQQMSKKITKDELLEKYSLKNYTSLDTEGESDKEMSPSVSQRLSQYRRMNLLDINSSSSSENEEDVEKDKNRIADLNTNGKISLKQINSNDNEAYKSDTEKLIGTMELEKLKQNSKFENDDYLLNDDSLKSDLSSEKNENTESYIFKQAFAKDIDNSEKVSAQFNLTLEKKENEQKLKSKKNTSGSTILENIDNSKNVPAQVNNSEKKKENKKKLKNKKNIIINETEESLDSQKIPAESQEMFSSLEDLTKNQLDSNERPHVDDSNDVILNKTSVISSEKITKITQLVEKENLLENTYEATMVLNEISADEEIYIFQVPKNVFNKNLISEKMIFSNTTLIFGNQRYEAFQRHNSSTLSCVLKTGRNKKDSFKTVNIRPVVSIVARRKQNFEDLKKKRRNSKINKEIKKLESLPKSMENEFESNKTDDSLLNRCDKNEIKDEKEKKIKKNEKLSTSVEETKNKEKLSKKINLEKNKFTLNNFIKKTSKKCIKKEKNPTKIEILKKNESTDYDINDKKLDHNDFGDSSKDLNLQLEKPFKEDKNYVIGEDMKKVNNCLSKALNVVFNSETGFKSIKENESKKRKAQNKLNEDIKSEVEIKKKRKNNINEKKLKSTNKNVKSKKRKINANKEFAELAAQEIKRIIEKTIKFNKEDLNSSNSSIEASKYGALDIERTPFKKRKCQVSFSSSDENDKTFERRSFQVIVKAKPEENEEKITKPSFPTSSIDISQSGNLSVTKLKKKDKKAKKIYFDE